MKGVLFLKIKASEDVTETEVEVGCESWKDVSLVVGYLSPRP